MMKYTINHKNATAFDILPPIFIFVIELIYVCPIFIINIASDKRQNAPFSIKLAFINVLNIG
ncbi:MAG: hypothetical protein M1332_02925 [Deltaproteobacteria bacterium]|nr:hypothetical protein [Deltaproteobacteria bacterium]